MVSVSTHVCTFVLLTIAWIPGIANCAGEWGYEKDYGPGQWKEIFPNCGGSKQSPINITTSKAKIDNSLPIFNRSLFEDAPSRMVVQNNGHTIMVSLTNGNIIRNSSFLPFTAQVAQYHFHWGNKLGQNLTGGSEHMMNGMRYFGEMHVVASNTKYDNVSEASSKSDGLAVFAFFMQVGHPEPNPNFEILLNFAATAAKAKNSSGPLNSAFSISSLLPSNLSVYYRYQGSLTTPPCYESVTWTVFDKPIVITKAQATKLTTSFDRTMNSSQLLVQNFRPVQALNGRSVTRPRISPEKSGANKQHPKALVSFVACVIAVCILVKM